LRLRAEVHLSLLRRVGRRRKEVDNAAAHRVFTGLHYRAGAAVAVPVEEARDRLRAENDYKVNLRAELEVRGISEKIDQLIHQQWAHLLEVQEIEMEMIRDLVGGGAAAARARNERPSRERPLT
jgi:hypothetical protein